MPNQQVGVSWQEGSLPRWGKSFREEEELLSVTLKAGLGSGEEGAPGKGAVSKGVGIGWTIVRGTLGEVGL